MAHGAYYSPKHKSNRSTEKSYDMAPRVWAELQTELQEDTKEKDRKQAADIRAKYLRRHFKYLPGGDQSK